jgi:hypothetical protein
MCDAEFAVAKSDLTKPTLLILLLPHAIPAVIPLRSIAGADFDITTLAIASMTSMGISDAGDVQRRKWLLVIDPSLGRVARRSTSTAPVSRPHASGPTTAQNGSTSGQVLPEATSASSASFETPSAATQEQIGLANHSWSGVINDARGGRGQIKLTFSNGNGSFTATFCCNMSNFGQITDLQQASNGVFTFVLVSARGPGCNYAVTSTMSNNRLQGSYSGCGNNGGTFDLQRADP